MYNNIHKQDEINVLTEDENEMAKLMIIQKNKKIDLYKNKRMETCRKQTDWDWYKYGLPSLQPDYTKKANLMMVNRFDQLG